MSVRTTSCPGCSISVNVPLAMTNVKCPKCATVWNPSAPAAATPSPHATANRINQTQADANEESEQQSMGNAALIAGVVGGAMMLIAMAGLILVVVNREGTPIAAEIEETIKPAVPEPYREIRKPEEQRRRIYADYRRVARTTVETPLILPQGTKARQSLEDTLDGVFDRELTRFAALHDISVDDVKEVIKEGDAKKWDTTPRSNAVRDGKRVYTKEMSEGWEKNPNRK